MTHQFSSFLPLDSDSSISLRECSKFLSRMTVNILTVISIKTELLIISVPLKQLTCTTPHSKLAHDKMRNGADLNGDNLRTSTAYLQISDHCTVRVRVRVRIKVRLGLGLDLGLQIVVNCDKMRINHMIKTDQRRCAPQIRPTPHFVVSLKTMITNIMALLPSQSESKLLQ